MVYGDIRDIKEALEKVADAIYTYVALEIKRHGYDDRSLERILEIKKRIQEDK
jgi:hypothetical protein